MKKQDIKFRGTIENSEYGTPILHLRPITPMPRYRMDMAGERVLMAAVYSMCAEVNLALSGTPSVKTPVYVSVDHDEVICETDNRAEAEKMHSFLTAAKILS
jgi:hypothetical protein